MFDLQPFAKLPAIALYKNNRCLVQNEGIHKRGCHDLKFTKRLYFLKNPYS